MARDTIFISHATPEDNDFVRWLGTRLVGHGYKVWADLFDLKGGTPFWSTIEEALRHHACKVIFVVSRKGADPDRTGVRNELSVADAIKKAQKDPGFIIPVRIDDTPFADFPIQIHQLNAIDFSKGWGPKLLDLLDTLRTSNVPRTDDDQTAEFERWRASMVHVDTVVEVAPERVLTNLLPILGLPETINFFGHDADNAAMTSALKSSGIPHATFYRLVIAFAPAAAFQEHMPLSFVVRPEATVNLDDLLAGTTTGVTSPKAQDARNMVTAMLRDHVERHLLARGLKRFEGSGTPSYFFPKGLLDGDKVSYVAASGRRTYKQVVGRSDKRGVNWHLAMKVNVVLNPPAVVRFKPYVCFSEDGLRPIADPKRTSAIRRGFCRSWWNAHWRQLQEAFCVFLADGRDTVAIPLDGPSDLVLSGSLLELTCARRMPDDLKLGEEVIEPDDPDVEDDGVVQALSEKELA